MSSLERGGPIEETGHDTEEIEDEHEQLGEETGMQRFLDKINNKLTYFYRRLPISSGLIVLKLWEAVPDGQIFDRRRR